MLNFEEELQKFKPSMEIDDIEDALYQETLREPEPAPGQMTDSSRQENRE